MTKRGGRKWVLVPWSFSTVPRGPGRAGSTVESGQPRRWSSEGSEGQKSTCNSVPPGGDRAGTSFHDPWYSPTCVEKCKYLVRGGPPGPPPPQAQVVTRRAHRPQYIVGPPCISAKNTEHRQGRGKPHGVTSGGRPAQASESPLPMGSQRTPKEV